MKLKKVIQINKDKCDGCGECTTNCQKGGIKIVNGTAKLVKTSFCGSFIDCISDCPNGALTIKTKKLSNTDLEKEIAPNASCYYSGRYNINQWVE